MNLTARMDSTTLRTTTCSVTPHDSNAGYARPLCPPCLCGDKGSNFGYHTLPAHTSTTNPVTHIHTWRHLNAHFFIKIPCSSPIRVEKQGQVINHRSQVSHNAQQTPTPTQHTTLFSPPLFPLSYILFPPPISQASEPRMRLKLLHQRLEQIALSDDADHTLIFVNHR